MERERELAAVIEKELKSELKHMKKFDRLNNEKITPHFKALTKKSRGEEQLSDIHRDDGTVFGSEQDQNKYITYFYKNLYKKPHNRLGNNNIDIHAFLGEIAERDEVKSAILTENERQILDAPLNILELDKSMNDANFNSATGMNGISNKFIKNNWELFRLPLFWCALHIFETGIMPDSFKTAKIKVHRQND